MFKKILLPTDGSPVSERAIAAAVELARATGATLVGFHSTEPYPVAIYGEYVLADSVPPEQYRQQTAKRSKDLLGAIEAAAMAAGVRFEAVTVDARSPAEAIIAAAKDQGCDTIVMASRGRGAMGSLLLGSETMKVLTHSTLPVMVVR